MDRSTRKLAAGRMLLAAMLLTIVMSLSVQAMNGKCVPTKAMPELDSMEVKNVASVQRLVVANMIGYVHLVEDDSYLPLDISSVELEDRLIERNATLEGACTQFKIGISKYWGDSYKYKNLDMFIRDKSNGYQSFKKICEFNSKFELEHSNHVRYSCTKPASHRCSDPQTGKLVAVLELKSFEFEFRAYQAKTGEFGKQPWADSCLAW